MTRIPPPPPGRPYRFEGTQEKKKPFGGIALPKVTPMPPLEGHRPLPLKLVHYTNANPPPRPARETNAVAKAKLVPLTAAKVKEEAENWEKGSAFKLQQEFRDTERSLFTSVGNVTAKLARMPLSERDKEQLGVRELRQIERNSRIVFDAAGSRAGVKRALKTPGLIEGLSQFTHNFQAVRNPRFQEVTRDWEQGDKFDFATPMQRGVRYRMLLEGIHKEETKELARLKEQLKSVAPRSDGEKALSNRIHQLGQEVKETEEVLKKLVRELDEQNSQISKFDNPKEYGEAIRKVRKELVALKRQSGRQDSERALQRLSGAIDLSKKVGYALKNELKTLEELKEDEAVRPVKESLLRELNALASPQERARFDKNVGSFARSIKDPKATLTKAEEIKLGMETIKNAAQRDPNFLDSLRQLELLIIALKHLSR